MDEDDRGPGAFLELVHQVEDLGLDGDVEGGGRLVRDEKARVAGHRHRDHHPLAEPAGKLERVLPRAPRAQDYDAATALLAEAGFGPGELEFVFKTTTNYPWHVEATQILVEWFRQGGVKASVQQLTPGRTGSASAGSIAITRSR